MTRRIVRAVALVALYVVLDLLEAAAYLAGVGYLTARRRLAQDGDFR